MEAYTQKRKDLFLNVKRFELKKSKMNKKFAHIAILNFIILFSCSNIPNNNDQRKSLDEIDAERSFNGLEDELSKDTENNSLINEKETTGSISLPSSEDFDFQKNGKNISNKSGWVEVEERRIFSNSVSPQHAKREMIQSLRNIAISKKVPPTVEISSLLSDIMVEKNNEAFEESLWSGFFRSTVSGLITAEKILIDELRPVEGVSSFEKRVKLKVFVEPVKGLRDPSFYLDVEMDNNKFKSGDELAFKITPSIDCYVYVFNFLANHHIQLMYPNYYMNDNFIQAKTTLEIPDKRMREFITITVSPMPEEDITSESIYIVCTKKPVKIIEDIPIISTSMKTFPYQSDDFVEFQKWLTKIPLDQRVEKNLSYFIIK